MIRLHAASRSDSLAGFSGDFRVVHEPPAAERIGLTSDCTLLRSASAQARFA